jgi:hypothetical protein
MPSHRLRITAEAVIMLSGAASGRNVFHRWPGEEVAENIDMEVSSRPSLHSHWLG